MGEAMKEVSAAREALKVAEESGDEKAIKLAKERVAAAEKGETKARRAFHKAQDQMARRIAAEVQLASAIKNTAKVATKAANDSARQAEEAKQRLIDQAYLQYRLAVAGTAAAQLPIWQEELAKVAKGSAEYWNIMTRIVQLQRKVSTDGAMAAGVAEGVADDIDQAGRSLKGAVFPGEKIDWWGIGKAIGGELIGGLVEKAEAQLDIWAKNLETWATDPKTIQGAIDTGEAWGTAIANALADALTPKATEWAIDPKTLRLGQVQRESTLLDAMANLGVTLVGAMWDGWEAEWERRGGFAGFLAQALGIHQRVKEAVERGGEHELNWLERFMRNYGRWYGQSFPGFASGTDYYPGGWSIVGEQGPELVRMPRGAQVFSAAETRRMAANNITINVNLRGERIRQEAKMGVLEGLRAAGVA